MNRIAALAVFVGTGLLCAVAGYAQGHADGETTVVEPPATTVPATSMTCQAVEPMYSDYADYVCGVPEG